MNSDRKGVKELREALEAKITKLNLLESESINMVILLFLMII